MKESQRIWTLLSRKMTNRISPENEKEMLHIIESNEGLKESIAILSALRIVHPDDTIDVSMAYKKIKDKLHLYTP